MKQKLPLIIFVFGFLVGLALAVVVIWADLEASLFNPTILADDPLNGLRCPLFMTTGETRQISASVKNDRDRPLTVTLRGHFTAGAVTLIQEVDSQETLEAGETRWVSWPVSSEDAAFDRLILARISTLRAFGEPPRQGSCGVVVLDWPFVPGWLISAFILTLSLASMGGGAYWHFRQRKPVGAARRTAVSLAVLAFVVIFGVIAGVMGWWLAGLGMLIIMFLLLVTANLERLAV